MNKYINKYFEWVTSFSTGQRFMIFVSLFALAIVVNVNGAVWLGYPMLFLAGNFFPSSLLFKGKR